MTPAILNYARGVQWRHGIDHGKGAEPHMVGDPLDGNILIFLNFTTITSYHFHTEKQSFFGPPNFFSTVEKTTFSGR